MNKTILFRKLRLALCLSSIIFMQSTNAFARPGMGGSSHRGPEDIMAGHRMYHYRDGRFYRPVFFGLFKILVDIPPIGAIVTVLPAGYQTIVVRDITYYYYDNIYFTACPSGYIVVPAPSAVVVSSIAAQPQKISRETVTINVPNSNGSYTPVTLVKQKDGYIGPQGEYYPDHPTVEQLKVLYGT